MGLLVKTLYEMCLKIIFYSSYRYTNRWHSHGLCKYFFYLIHRDNASWHLYLTCMTYKIRDTWVRSLNKTVRWFLVITMAQEHTWYTLMICGWVNSRDYVYGTNRDQIIDLMVRNAWNYTLSWTSCMDDQNVANAH